MTEPKNIPQPGPVVERLVYETPWLDFYYDDITHLDGTPGHHAWVRSHSGNGAVMTIPVTPSGKYLLIRVYRHPVKQYLWEFPAGVMEDGETPLETGRRELIEETGIVPEKLELLGSQVPIAGYVGTIFHSVLAVIPEIEIGDLKLQAEEGIVDAKLLTRAELVAMVTSQDLADGVTLTCLARHWAHQEANS